MVLKSEKNIIATSSAELFSAVLYLALACTGVLWRALACSGLLWRALMCSGVWCIECDHRWRTKGLRQRATEWTAFESRVEWRKVFPFPPDVFRTPCRPRIQSLNADITLTCHKEEELYHAVLTVYGEDTPMHSREVLKVTAEHVVLLRYVNDLYGNHYMTR